MSKLKKAKTANRPPPKERPAAKQKTVWVVAGLAAALVAVAAGAAWRGMREPANAPAAVTATAPSSAATPSAATPPTAALTTNEVAQAVMVTVELDFGGTTPSIRDALQQVERRSQPADGRGRTFAILDAYGEATPEGKLHMSMHVSMEKPGLGELIFRRTGEVLWKARIIPSAKNAPGEKNLTVIMKDPEGRSAVLDGSKDILRVLDIPLRDAGALVRDRWPDGQECEFTFIYSACGCPVKAKVRRLGDSTVRSTELPVMFPDDPAAMTVINQLMGWVPDS
ncbi:MAG TPA: hypothetical protein VNU68_13535 [Verrucomicrobiae bacterium]|nr:hypothetical protein [Verrucomicrobiae bacterium]